MDDTINDVKDKKSFKDKYSKISEKATPYIFIAPFYILFLIFGLFPIVFSAILAFSKWDGIGDVQFTGLENFKTLLADTDFWLSIKNTLIIWVIQTVPMLVIALVLAFLINLSIVKRKEFYKTTFFLPYVTSVVAVTILFGLIFSNQSGLINAVLELLGKEPIAFIDSPFWIRIIIALVGIWQYLGYNMIIYFSGLQKISADYYEAAIIDGASNYQLFTKITVPLLKPIILFTVMMSTIGGLQVFAEAQVLVPTNATAEGGALTIVYYIYQTAFLQSRYGYGSTITWGLVVIILIISLINWYLTSYRIKGEDD
ncbi:cellobiose transport system permease protein [Bacillus niacini]|uniref:Cellobiose transport system permease protein n=1 Tax=Neobacillus niacini TaxID=86668 RepID=A0A852TCA2_9BACI|nr:sugar ABC transporter permease [Neobacillus niacini]NYE05831.1 cellobiose transport system permease protein [Neobacillus niacini]